MGRVSVTYIASMQPMLTTTFLHDFRSRDNTRSERLWVDMTRGVGQKWKVFFWSLEDDGDLDREERHPHMALARYLYSLHQLRPSGLVGDVEPPQDADKG